jgi:Branched-chain amino acid ABC-type transport system, permease components
LIYAQVLVDGLTVGLMFALVAMGLSLIYGVMNIVNFAHGEFMMIAMYLCYFLWSGLGLDPIASAPLAAVAMLVLGIAIYRWIARYLLDASMVAQVFATFGLLLFFQALANYLWRADARTIGENWSTGLFSLGGLYFNGPELVAAAGALITALALFWFLNRTETGLCLQATAEDPQVARLMGINTDRMFALAWGLSAATVGVAGALASTYLAITPLVGANWALPAFVAVAIGGFGSISGAFWGGIIIGLVQTAGGFFTSPSYKLLFVYLLFIVVVLVRPHGLMGKR